ncbi:MAG: hypothetical protein Q8O16_05430 [Dehalococcoidia bacterium]|nr:hypothetical protein [Dehalococcoidia bacterium]
MTSQVELLNPVARVTIKDRPVAKLLDTLDGKVVGVWETYNYWRSFGLLVGKLKEVLPARYGVKEVIWHKPTAAGGVGFADPNMAQIEQKYFSEFAKKVDCVITGGGY